MQNNPRDLIFREGCMVKPSHLLKVSGKLCIHKDCTLKVCTPEGLHPEGLQRQGLQAEGLQRQGLHLEGLQAEGLHHEGLHPEGLHPQGLHPEGLHPQGLPAYPACRRFESTSGGLPEQLSVQIASRLPPLDVTRPAPVVKAGRLRSCQRMSSGVMGLKKDPCQQCQ